MLEKIVERLPAYRLQRPSHLALRPSQKGEQYQCRQSVAPRFFVRMQGFLWGTSRSDDNVSI